MRWNTASIGAVVVLATVPLSLAQAPLTVAGSIDLPRVEGRIDHLAFDADRQRLLIAALGNNTVEVIDLKKGSHAKSLPGFHEPQGIVAVPDARLVAVANGRGEGLQLLNADDYRPGQMTRLGNDSDNVRYDASARRIYVGFGGGALAAVNPADGTVLGEVKLAGQPSRLYWLPQAGQGTGVRHRHRQGSRGVRHRRGYGRSLL